MSSPRRWGCFSLKTFRFIDRFVFPTQVGVFLNSYTFMPTLLGLPHAGGGVSNRCETYRSWPPSSPRRWGCFCLRLCLCCHRVVFPTQVGVFLLCKAKLIQIAWSSPRRWGCFYRSSSNGNRPSVFPTQVGVFPFCHSRLSLEDCLPHAGGGVSQRE